MMRHLRAWCGLCVVVSAAAESDCVSLAEAQGDDSSPVAMTMASERSFPIGGVRKRITPHGQSLPDWEYQSCRPEGAGDGKAERAFYPPPTPAEVTQREGLVWTALWAAGAIGLIAGGAAVYMMESMDPRIPAAIFLGVYTV